MKRLVLDIETRPNPELADDPSYWLTKRQELTPPSNWKDELKIEAWYTEQLGKMRDQMALHAHLGLVAFIGVADLDSDDEPSVFGSDEDCTLANESLLLEAFDDYIVDACKNGSHLVGFNLRRFDLPFLWGRAAVQHGLLTEWLPYPKDYRRVTDLCDLFGGGGLDDWMFACGLGRKAVSGEAVLKIPLPELRKHCAEDLKATREIANRVMRSYDHE